MGIELKMPALSPTMEEGTLAKWLVKEGDTVSSGDILAEIETDKATMEFEAVDEGTISKILVPEGSDGVKVGTVIALMGGEGEEPAPPQSVRAEPVEALPLSAEPEDSPSTSSGRTDGVARSTAASPPAANAAPPSPATPRRWARETRSGSASGRRSCNWSSPPN